MSGLEPVAALGLACNILQIIGVARETVRVAKQVYQNGELDPALTDHATRLGDISKRVRSMTTAPTTTTATARGAAQHAAAQPKPKSRDIQLLELANRCLSTARDLREEVNFLVGSLTASKLADALKIAAKTTWRKKRLDRLNNDLRDAERLLQTGLLSRIYERTEKTDGALEKLDADLRSFVDEYRKGRSDAAALAIRETAQSREHVTIQVNGATDTIKTYMTRVEDSLKTHITQATTQAETSLRDHISTTGKSADGREDARMEARRERLLRSLKFDRMNERRNMVAESHPKTFQWVLRDGSEAGEPTAAAGSPAADANSSWDSFSDWLRSTEPEYWISGKPGSGKTMLVKYLLGHSRTREYLELWSPGSVLVSHFFWRPGTQLQQSIKGLFCSLLYQLLDENKASIDRILDSNMSASHKDTETDWSGLELQSMLVDVMAHYPKSIALFLDGLDEVLPADGTLALLNVIDALKLPHGLQGKVKLCLGARREPLIEGKLRACPQLRLENLNHSDFRRYAEDTIIIPPDYSITMFPGSSLYWWNENGILVASFNCESLPTPPETREWLVTELVSKAEGVFLWLCLTARAIMDALYQGETITDLKHRIDILPSDLTKLYADMWTRANGDTQDHRERAALYFQLAIDGDINDRLTMMIATRTEMANLIQDFNPYERGRAAWLVGLCKASMRDVELRCAGLLRSNPIREGGYPSSILKPWYGTEYCDLIPYAEADGSPPPFEFIHRTARDFLTDTEEGKRILSINTVSEWHRHRRIIAACLASCRLLRIPHPQIARPLIGRVRYEPLYYSGLRRHLASIPRLLDPLPKGDAENARRQRDDLIHCCEKLFKSGQLSGDRRTLNHDEDDQEERQSRWDDDRSRDEVVVKREHEFLLQAASINLNIWPFILAKVQALKLDNQTLSELLLHVCNMTIYDRQNYFRFQRWEGEIEDDALGIESRLKLAKLLLEQGASPLRKGPRRINNPSKYVAHGHIDLPHVLETPLKGLISSIWHLDRDTTVLTSNLASYFISFIKLLTSYGANLNMEEFRVTYQVLDGHLFERQLHFPYDPLKMTPEREIDDMWVVLAYPLSVILARMLQSWEDRYSEIDTFPEVRDTTRDGARLGRLVLMLHSRGTPARMCFVETEEELGEELLWVKHAAEDILQAEDRRDYGVPVPLKVQQGLSRALERRHTEGAKESREVDRLLFDVLKRAGMTSVYWEWEDGCVFPKGALLGN
jgi:hypothetical protein